MTSADSSTANFLPLLVRASAGTGKTYSLALRYIALLACGETPDHILATTFTRKAAGEIQTRIVQLLGRASVDQEFADQLGKDAQLSNGLSARRALSLLKQLLQLQHRVNICTLDSLFYRMASSFSLELGLRPAWRLASDEDNLFIAREAVRALCQGSDPERLSSLMQIINSGRYKRAVQESIARRVTDLHDVFLETVRAAWSWLPHAAGLEAAELNLELDRLAALCEMTVSGKEKKPDKRLYDALHLAQRKEWEDFLGKGYPHAILEKDGIFSRKPIAAEIVAALSPLIQQAKVALLNRLAAENEACYDLLSDYNLEYEKLRQQNNNLSFSDVKQRLAQAALGQQLTDLYFRLDMQVKHLLLDEFQDTSSVEWRVLEPFADEVLSKASGENSFYCVGDVKQAIYGWRGGKAEIFDSLERRYPQLGRKTLELSYRSAGTITDLVNRIFVSLPDNSALERYRSAVSIWVKGFIPQATARRDLLGYARLENVRVEADEEAEAALSRRCAELTKELVTQNTELKIGILARSNKAVRRIVFELNSPEFNVRASEEGGNPLTDALAVTLLLSLLRAIEHPGDGISRFHVACSPLGEVLGLRDHADLVAFEEYSLKARREIGADGLARFIWALAQRVSERFSANDARRLAQLAQLAHEFDRQPNLRLENFIQIVETKKVEAGDSSNVRVLTIHKAKGLEFDAVILPDLHPTLLGSPAKDKIMVFSPDAARPPERVSLKRNATVRALNENLERMAEELEEAKVKEAISLLYVALTRPRQALFMLVPEQKRAGLSAASILRAALASDVESSEEALLFESGDKNWWRSPHGARGPVSTTTIVDVTELPKAKPVEQRLLAHESPSKLEQRSGSSQRKLISLENIAARRRGTLLHLLCAQVEWFEEAALSSERCLNQLWGIGVEGSEARDLYREFVQLISAPEIARIFNRAQYCGAANEALVRRELPFSILQEGTLLSGTIDRLVLKIEGGKVAAAHILDFKTDRLRADELRARIETYRPQLDAYRRAMEVCFGLTAAQVTAELVFLRAGSVQPI